MGREARPHHLDLVLEQGPRRRAGPGDVSHRAPRRIDTPQQAVERRLPALDRGSILERRARVEDGADHVGIAIGVDRAVAGAANIAREPLGKHARGVAVPRVARRRPRRRQIAQQPRPHQIGRVVAGTDGRRGITGVDHVVEHGERRPQVRRVARAAEDGEQQIRGLGVAEARDAGVRSDGGRDRAAHGFHLVLETGRLERPATRRRATHGQPLHQRSAPQDRRVLLAVAPRHLREQLLQAAARHRVVEGEIRSAEKRRAIGREEHRDGIAAQAGEELHRPGVALCHIRPLVTIDSHGDDQ